MCTHASSTKDGMRTSQQHWTLSVHLYIADTDTVHQWKRGLISQYIYILEYWGFVCPSCCTEYHRRTSLNNTDYFFNHLGGWESEIQGRASTPPPRPLSLGWRLCLLSLSSRGQLSIALLKKTPVLWDQSLLQRLLFFTSLKHPISFKDLIFKHGHILRCWGSGLYVQDVSSSHYYWGEPTLPTKLWQPKMSPGICQVFPGGQNYLWLGTTAIDR